MGWGKEPKAAQAVELLEAVGFRWTGNSHWMRPAVRTPRCRFCDAGHPPEWVLDKDGWRTVHDGGRGESPCAPSTAASPPSEDSNG